MLPPAPRHALLIGLTGRPLAGKDTCAEFLARDLHAWPMAFADALRTECAWAWGVPVDTFTCRDTKELPLPQLAVARCRDIGFRLLGTNGDRDWDLHAPRSPRWVMQQWGTEYRRSASRDYWVHLAATAIVQLRTQGVRTIVVTDVRFANEADAIRRLGGWVLRVHRPELPPLEPGTASHASELQAARLAVDGEVHNDGTLDHLRAELARVVDALQAADSVLHAAPRTHVTREQAC